MVPPATERLLSTIAGVAGVVPADQSPPEGALHTSVWSLPYHARARLDHIPQPEGYLAAPPDGPRLGEGTGFRVGVAWAGNPSSTYDRDRSIPTAELLRPLLGLPGTEWISLQVGHRAAEAESLPISPVPELADFAQTAALLEQLDLVITVDTAIGHLAGALGIPAWIILPSIPEYRWLLDRDDTPWYRSVRLFRREHTNDWEGVIGRVGAALALRVGMAGSPRS